MALTLNNQEHIFDKYKEDKLEKPNYLIKECMNYSRGLKVRFQKELDKNRAGNHCQTLSKLSGKKVRLPSSEIFKNKWIICFL